MNPNLKLKFDQMKSSNPAENNFGNEENYFRESNARNVCFVQPKGNAKFLNYAYLVSGEYFPEDNKIILTFTSDIVTLNGHNLETLFYEFMQHLPQQITCADERYNVLEEGKEPVVNKISIETNTDN